MSYPSQSYISYDEYNSFVERVTNTKTLTAYHFTNADFQSMKYKSPIRDLFERHVGKIDYMDTLPSTDNQIRNFNRNVDKMKAYNATEFGKLFRLKVGDKGPGEILLYHAINDVVLSRTGMDFDASSGSKNVEIKKAIKRQSTKELYNFKIGNTEKTSSAKYIVDDLLRLAKRNKIIGETTESISATPMLNLKNNAKKEYDAIVKGFASVVLEYLKNKVLVAFDDKTGHIVLCTESIGADDIGIYEITQGIIKPTIKYIG